MTWATTMFIESTPLALTGATTSSLRRNSWMTIQAAWDSEKWLRGERPTKANIEATIEDFDEYYSGEFLDGARSKFKDKIVSELFKRLKGR